MMSIGEFGIGLTENPLVDIFLYSHHLSSWFCFDVVRRILFWSLMKVKWLKRPDSV